SVLGQTEAKIRVLGADGSGQRAELTGSEPVWSPDGTRIAFYGKPMIRAAQLCVANADGTNLIVLDQGAISGPFSSSPDGKQIVFARYTTYEMQTLYVVNADGSERPQRLTDGRAPSWS